MREVVRLLPRSMATGPDGFTAEFLQICWGVVKTDVMTFFSKLHSLSGRMFQGLNQAQLIPLPKQPTPQLCGIIAHESLSHLRQACGKDFGNIKKCCHREWEASWRINACSFRSGAPTTTRYLHRLKEPWTMLKLDIAQRFGHCYLRRCR